MYITSFVYSFIFQWTHGLLLPLATVSNFSYYLTILWIRNSGRTGLDYSSAPHCLLSSFSAIQLVTGLVYKIHTGLSQILGASEGTANRLDSAGPFYLCVVVLGLLHILFPAGLLDSELQDNMEEVASTSKGLIQNWQCQF